MPYGLKDSLCLFPPSLRSSFHSQWKLIQQVREVIYNNPAKEALSERASTEPTGMFNTQEGMLQSLPFGKVIPPFTSQNPLELLYQMPL